MSGVCANSDCGSPLTPDDRFCPACGTPCGTELVNHGQSAAPAPESDGASGSERAGLELAFEEGRPGRAGWSHQLCFRVNNHGAEPVRLAACITFAHADDLGAPAGPICLQQVPPAGWRRLSVPLRPTVPGVYAVTSLELWVWPVAAPLPAEAVCHEMIDDDVYFDVLPAEDAGPRVVVQGNVTVAPSNQAGDGNVTVVNLGAAPADSEPVTATWRAIALKQTGANHVHACSVPGCPVVMPAARTSRCTLCGNTFCPVHAGVAETNLCCRCERAVRPGQRSDLSATPGATGAGAIAGPDFSSPLWGGSSRAGTCETAVLADAMTPRLLDSLDVCRAEQRRVAEELGVPLVREDEAAGPLLLVPPGRIVLAVPGDPDGMTAVVERPFWMSQAPLSRQVLMHLAQAAAAAGSPLKRYLGSSTFLRPGTVGGVSISAQDILDMCRYLTERGCGTYRLPTELEWIMGMVPVPTEHGSSGAAFGFAAIAGSVEWTGSRFAPFTARRFGECCAPGCRASLVVRRPEAPAQRRGVASVRRLPDVAVRVVREVD